MSIRSSLLELIRITLAVVILCPSVLYAEAEPVDKTLSPYFFVKSNEAGMEQFPLKSTAAEVKIVGTIADVRVTQSYKNEGKTTIEAIYVFPGSTEAAVYGLQMTIGQRVIKAKIKERSEAKATYEAAKKEGKSASLLEQHRPNVFQMNVANILPGDEINVELKYTEKLKPTDGVYEFIYPTVVGPRYVSNNSSGTTVPGIGLSPERWTASPYSAEAVLPGYAFDFNLTLNAGMAIKDMATPSHKTSIQYEGPNVATVKLDVTEREGGNRDLVLRYRLAGDAIESGLLLYPGDKENFFLATIQPPKRVSEEEILPREYIFVVDVSGSMFGFPLDISKTLLRDLVGGLKPTDRFNLLLFAGGSDVLAPVSLQASTDNIERAIQLIENQRGGGATEILPALKRAFALPRDEHHSRSVVVITDGYISIENEVFEIIRRNLNNTNLFAFGIGTSVNRHLVEGMARVGRGEPFVVLNQIEAPSRAKEFRKLIQSPLLSKINITYYDFDVYDVEPLSVPDMLAERPIQIFGKYRGTPKGRLVLSGDSAHGSYVQEFDLTKITAHPGNEAIKYLWARDRIRLLSDYNFLSSEDEKRREVVSLGITYNLLTQYTSFVAVDEIVRAKEPSTEVKQALPLPQGVSNLALGGVAPTVPEPEEWALLLIAALMLGSIILRRRSRICISQ